MSSDPHSPSRFWNSGPSSWASPENTIAGRLFATNPGSVRVLSSYSEHGRIVSILDPEDSAERIQRTLPGRVPVLFVAADNAALVCKPL